MLQICLDPMAIICRPAPIEQVGCVNKTRCSTPADDDVIPRRQPIYSAAHASRGLIDAKQQEVTDLVFDPKHQRLFSMCEPSWPSVPILLFDRNTFKLRTCPATSIAR
jgi:hypothetical protein